MNNLYWLLLLPRLVSKGVDMKQFKVSLGQYEPTALYGVWMVSDDRSISRDIARLSKRYYAVSGKRAGFVLPFYVLSKDYDQSTGRFRLFIGSDAPAAGLDEFIIPKGRRAKISVRPKLGFLWGLSIGEAKRFFYTKWLPACGLSALNMEYELHTEKSLGAGATVELLFVVET